MLVLITYDVNTQTEAGRKRLRKVAKESITDSVFKIQYLSAKWMQQSVDR